jgi:hypothetical protein
MANYAFPSLLEFPGKVLQAVGELLANETEPWDRANIERILHASNAKLDVPHKSFMTVLRHALSGMKVG